jgi:hypothetical protein
VRWFLDTEVAERYVAIDPETVKRVGWHRNYVSRFCDRLCSVERVDASSLLHDEHLPMGMAVLMRNRARRIGSHSDPYRYASLLKTNEPSRRTRKGLERFHIRCPDHRL